MVYLYASLFSHRHFKACFLHQKHLNPVLRSLTAFSLLQLQHFSYVARSNCFSVREGFSVRLLVSNVLDDFSDRRPGSDGLDELPDFLPEFDVLDVSSVRPPALDDLAASFRPIPNTGSIMVAKW